MQNTSTGSRVVAYSSKTENLVFVEFSLVVSNQTGLYQTRSDSNSEVLTGEIFLGLKRSRENLFCVGQINDS